MANCNYVLKTGALLQAFSDETKTCTNANLTDKLAEWHLKNNPACRRFFAVIPGEAFIPSPEKPGVPKAKTNILPPEVEKSSAADVAAATKTELHAELVNLRARLKVLKIDHHPLCGVVKLRKILNDALYPDNVKPE